MIGEGDNASPSETCKEAAYKDSFKEIDEVTHIINSLPTIYADNIAVELAIEKFVCESWTK